MRFLLLAFTLIVTFNSYLFATETINQKSTGDKSPVIYVSPEGSSNIVYKFENDVDLIISEVQKRFLSCLDVVIEFQNKSLNELNGKLSALAKSEETKFDSDIDWAKKLLKASPNKRKSLEKIKEKQKNYKEDFSKNLVAKLYKFFPKIFSHIDGKLYSIQKAGGQIELFNNDDLVLFSTTSDKKEITVLREIHLPNKSIIKILITSGIIKNGVIQFSPSMTLEESVNDVKRQRFSLKPASSNHGYMRLSTNKFEIPAPKSPMSIPNITYPDNRNEIDVGQILEKFDKSFDLFFQLAYSRQSP